MLKVLLGIEEASISDCEIMSKFKQARDQDLDEVEFLKADGSKVVVRLPKLDHSRYFDPWD